MSTRDGKPGCRNSALSGPNHADASALIDECKRKGDAIGGDLRTSPDDIQTMIAMKAGRRGENNLSRRLFHPGIPTQSDGNGRGEPDFFVILVSWMTLIGGQRWRAQPSRVGRLGRALGVFRICCGIDCWDRSRLDRSRQRAT